MSQRKIDLACGGTLKRAAAGYDVYTDVNPAREPIEGQFYQVPLESMPCFKDKEFDFARCHHGIEHVVDPDKACSEIIRIAKRGRISYPPAYACTMFGRRDHNWLVYEDRGRLLFIEKWFGSLGVPRSVTRCELNHNFDWTDSFEWQTIRISDMKEVPR